MAVIRNVHFSPYLRAIRASHLLPVFCHFLYLKYLVNEATSSREVR